MAAVEIPVNVAVVGSGLIVQVVNPQDSPGAIILQGNRVDGYRGGPGVDKRQLGKRRQRSRYAAMAAVDAAPRF